MQSVHSVCLTGYRRFYCELFMNNSYFVVCSSTGHGFVNVIQSAHGCSTQCSQNQFYWQDCVSAPKSE